MSRTFLHCVTLLLTLITRLSTIVQHPICVRIAFTGYSPAATVVMCIGAIRVIIWQGTCIARLFTLSKHVQWISVAFTGICPCGTIGIVVDTVGIVRPT